MAKDVKDKTRLDKETVAEFSMGRFLRIARDAFLDGVREATEKDQRNPNSTVSKKAQKVDLKLEEIHKSVIAVKEDTAAIRDKLEDIEVKLKGGQGDGFFGGSLFGSAVSLAVRGILAGLGLVPRVIKSLLTLPAEVASLGTVARSAASKATSALSKVSSILSTPLGSTLGTLGVTGGLMAYLYMDDQAIKRRFLMAFRREVGKVKLRARLSKAQVDVTKVDGFNEVLTALVSNKEAEATKLMGTKASWAIENAGTYSEVLHDISLCARQGYLAGWGKLPEDDNPTRPGDVYSDRVEVAVREATKYCGDISQIKTQTTYTPNEYGGMDVSTTSTDTRKSSTVAPKQTSATVAPTASPTSTSPEAPSSTPGAAPSSSPTAPPTSPSKETSSAGSGSSTTPGKPGAPSPSTSKPGSQALRGTTSGDRPDAVPFQRTTPRGEKPSPQHTGGRGHVGKNTGGSSRVEDRHGGGSTVVSPMTVSPGETNPGESGVMSPAVTSDVSPKVTNPVVGAPVSPGMRDTTEYGKQLRGDTRAEQIYNWMKDGGYTDAQAAGVVGNAMAESGRRLNPGQRQLGGAVSKGGDGAGGYGIFQWDDRKAALKRFAAGKGKPADDMKTQLEFLDHELSTSESRAASRLRRATTVEEATEAFTHFERPQGWNKRDGRGSHNYSGRLRYAEEVAEAGGKVGASSVAPKVTTADPEALTPSPGSAAPGGSRKDAKPPVLPAIPREGGIADPEAPMPGGADRYGEETMHVDPKKTTAEGFGGFPGKPIHSGGPQYDVTPGFLAAGSGQLPDPDHVSSDPRLSKVLAKKYGYTQKGGSYHVNAEELRGLREKASETGHTFDNWMTVKPRPQVSPPGKKNQTLGELERGSESMLGSSEGGPAPTVTKAAFKEQDGVGRAGGLQRRMKMQGHPVPSTSYLSTLDLRTHRGFNYNIALNKQAGLANFLGDQR